MSDEHAPADGPEPGGRESGGTGHGGPEPAPIRFFGTSWVRHDGGYGLRRAGVAVGSLALAAAGAAVLRFAFQGLEIASVGPFVGTLVVVGFAVCSALAFRHTWAGLTGRPGPSVADGSGQGLLLIGFVGSLLAYFCRSLVEAPGEQRHRAEYEAARERYERRRGARTGNPAARKAGGKTGAKAGAKKRR
ncbi:hypothetical protein HXP44_19830 [Streptomyces sioyaensis]|uniref:EamA/RhaT family transporter n=1 Tax=Streptomyces sioyaensis TaxID=67364 RepID=A0A4Q1QRZ1_9ACTN|nr:hypothetical protein [Streptomyces sioyaensis]MBM4794256.1 hypothetical protein [Streptomyces sioyaensis]RXS65822.1 hypothetical protein EST54_17430 [Streptomyces sioyaensis]